MTGQEPRDVDAFGFLLGPMHAYFSNVQTMSQNSGPMKGLMRTQLEIMGFMNRRTQAYMELPSRIAKCRTPQEFMSEQAQFWQTAFSQYSDSSRRVMEAWNQSLQTSVSTGSRTEHDYITFPAVKDPEPPETSPTVHRLRRRVA